MFKNLKIGVRLGLGFGLTLFFLVAISVISINRIGELTSNTVDIVDDRIPKIEMATEVRENLLVMARGLRSLILSTDKNFEKVQIENIAKARKRNGEILEKMKPLLTTEAEKSQLVKMGEARAKYSDAVDVMLQIADSSSPQYNAAKATAYLFNEYSQVANTYLERTKEFSDLQKKNTEVIGAQSIESANAAKYLVLFLSLGAFGFAVAFAWFVTRSITKPVNEALSAASRIAEGDLTVAIQSDSHDEVGLLMKAMQNMIGKLTQIIGEVRTAADNLTNAASQVSATAQVALAVVFRAGRFGRGDDFVDGADDGLHFAEYRECPGHRWHGFEGGHGGGRGRCSGQPDGRGYEEYRR